MAYDKKITTYDVQPVEVDGVLIGLTIKQWHRIERRADNDRVLERGSIKPGDEIEIPIQKVPDLVRELTDWPIWFATTKVEDR